MKRLFVDMDGTIARFHDEANYLEKMYEKDFFRNLKPFENMVKGIQDFMTKNPDVPVIALSAAIDSKFCVHEKQAWLTEHLPQLADNPIFTAMGENKAQAVNLQPGDVLIDDYNVNLIEWQETGGTAIKLVNNINNQGLVAPHFSGVSINNEAFPIEISTDLSRIMGIDVREQSFEQDNAQQTDDNVYFSKTPAPNTKYNVQQALDQTKEILTSYEKDPQLIADFLAFKSKLNLHDYSVRNTMLIYKQNPDVVFVGSFEKWKKLGHSVLKKQKGLKIMAPAKLTLFKPKGSELYKKVSQATPAEKQAIKSGQIKTVTKKVYVIGHVFDITQTNFPTEKYPELITMGVPSENHAQAYEALKGYLHEQGVEVKEVDLQSAFLSGTYSPNSRTIEINHLLNDTEKLSTLCHEAGHALYNHNHIKNIPVSVCECEADAFAICLQSRLGFEVTEKHKSHFKSHFDSCKDVKDFSAYSLLKSVKDKFNERWSEIEQALAPSLGIEQTAVQNIEISPQMG